MYILHFVYLFIHWWMFGLALPFCYCKIAEIECWWAGMFGPLFSIPLGIYLGMELLDYMVILYLTFRETTTKLFSTKNSPFCIPTSNVQGFWFFHIITDMYFLFFFKKNNHHCHGFGMVSHCDFDLHSSND